MRVVSQVPVPRGWVLLGPQWVWVVFSGLGQPCGVGEGSGESKKSGGLRQQAGLGVGLSDWGAGCPEGEPLVERGGSHVSPGAGAPNSGSSPPSLSGTRRGPDKPMEEELPGSCPLSPRLHQGGGAGHPGGWRAEERTGHLWGSSTRQHGARREGVSQRREGCVRCRCGDRQVTLVDSRALAPLAPLTCPCRAHGHEEPQGARPSAGGRVPQQPRPLGTGWGWGTPHPPWGPWLWGWGWKPSGNRCYHLGQAGAEGRH